MHKKDLNRYASQTHALLQKAQDTLKDDDMFLEVFVPDTYRQMYAHAPFDRNARAACSLPILQSIANLRTEIQSEISLILQSDPQMIEERFTDIPQLGELKESLDSMEDRIIERPFFTYVGELMETGTVLDLIGFMEKLRYDKLYQYTSCSLSKKIDIYISTIRSAFIHRYGADFYQRIECFKEACLKAFISEDLEFSTDSILSPRAYAYFIDSLEAAMKDGIFHHHRDVFLKEMKDIVLSHIPQDG